MWPEAVGLRTRPVVSDQKISLDLGPGFENLVLFTSLGSTRREDSARCRPDRLAAHRAERPTSGATPSGS